MHFSFNKVIIDVQWALISIITSSAAHFLLRIILGKELGSEGLGIYTLAFTIYLFGMQFAAFGIGSALTKYVAEFIDNQEKIKIFVSSGMISSIVTGTLMGVFFFLLAPFIANSFFHISELENLIKIVAFSYPFIAIQKAVLGTLNGFRKMNYYATLSILYNATIVGLSLLFVLVFRMGVYGAVIGLVISTFFFGFLSPILIHNFINFDKSLRNKTALKVTTVFGFYVVLSSSLSFLNTQIDTVLLGFFLRPSDVGVYAIAVLLAQIITLIPSAIQRVTAPVIAKDYANGEVKKIRLMIFTTMKKTFIFSLILGVFILIFGYFFIDLILTKDYANSYIPLMILLVGYIIYAPYISVAFTFGGMGKVHIPFRISVFITILNIIFNVLLIPQFGISGAAIASSLSLIFGFILFSIVLHIIFREELKHSKDVSDFL